MLPFIQKPVLGLLILVAGLVMPCGSGRLLAGDTLIIGTSYKVLLSTPNQDGMLDAIAREAFRRIGWAVELPYLPTERSIRAANDGLHDGELNRVAGMERLYPNLVRVNEPMMTFEFVGFTRNAAVVGGDWEQLRPHHVGIIKGWKILEASVGHFPQITYFHSAEELFHGLAAGHVEVVLYGKLIGCAVIAELGLNNLRMISPAFAKRDMYMYLHVKHRQLVAALADALAQMKRDGTYDAIVARSLTPYEKCVSDAHE